MERYYIKVIATAKNDPNRIETWYYGERRHFTAEKPQKGWLNLFGYHSLCGARRGLNAHQSTDYWEIVASVEMRNC